ncbi:MAG: Fibronectin type-III protein, partial [Bacteroidota bacterium]|nr:Fibronectin type-III protein [Bacteroidota bacterium]
MRKLNILLLALVMLVIGAAQSFAVPKVEFSIANRQVVGGVYQADLMANAAGSAWSVGSCIIYINYNSSGLDASAYDVTNLLNIDATLAGASYEVKQNHDSPGILFITVLDPGSYTSKSGSFRIGTIQFDITNGSLNDNITFDEWLVEVNDGPNLLTWFCSEQTCANFTNPTPQQIVGAANAPTVTTTSITNITSNSASSGGNVTSDGGASVTAKGVCWNTTGNPVATGDHTSDGTGTGSYTSSITGLNPGTVYYVSAYATNSAGTGYGASQTFTTLAVAPTVTTTTPFDITSSTAKSGGQVTSDGGSNITARGVCWSTSGNPTTTDSHTSDGAATGSFSSTITGLAPGTAYFVRAYATNSIGTSYGSSASFTSLAVVPTLTTTTPFDITSRTALSGGNVTNSGGASVTARGVCWKSTATPTISDNLTNNGAGIGSYSSTITSLSPGKNYYVRAYATNSVGTGYGESQSFTTPAEIPMVSTITISDITSHSAKSGVGITSDGGADITAKG